MSIVATLRPFVFRIAIAPLIRRATGEATAKTSAQMFAPAFPFMAGGLNVLGVGT